MPYVIRDLLSEPGGKAYVKLVGLKLLIGWSTKAEATQFETVQEAEAWAIDNFGEDAGDITVERI